MPATDSRLLLVMLITAGVWIVPAVMSSTQQWAQLLDTPKHMSWLAAFLYQAPSWILLWFATPFVLLAARRWPIEGEFRLKRFGLHLFLAICFGFVFVLVAVPFRNLVHPKPVAWEFFGVPYFKSGPQFAVVGAFAYGLLVLIGSLLDTRARLKLLTAESGAEAGKNESLPQILVETRVGQSVIVPSRILWAQPDIGGGCVLKTDSGDIRARPSLAELEQLLAEHGFCRVHRSKLANISRITEVVGGAHREAEARLDTGDVIPVSRRRREELVAILSG
jgi:hypothetical protein